MRTMQAGGMRRTKGGNDGVKGEETDEIIEWDSRFYNDVSQHKSVRQLTLSQTPQAQTDSFQRHQENGLFGQTLT